MYFRTILFTITSILLICANSALAGTRSDVIARELDIIELQMNTPAITEIEPVENVQIVRPAPTPPAPKEGYRPPSVPSPISSPPPRSIQYRENTPEDEPLFKNIHTDVGGEVRVGAGITSQDFYWKRANFDLNERNFRILSDTQLNRKENTYDPAIFSRASFDVNAKTKNQKIAFHTNITVDPWSFTGKSEKVLIRGGSGAEGTGIILNPNIDTTEVQYLYWSNTGYTVNRSVRTFNQGDSIGLPELKIRNGKVPAVRVNSLQGSSSTTFDKWFDIPELKIHRDFQPIRELWMDVKPHNSTHLRIFPMAYHDQAYTSDDPLRLSNNKDYWEQSPWLNAWQSGHFNDNSPTASFDYFQGFWDNSLAFFTKNSDGQYLTALRGASLTFAPSESTTFDATVATPKTLWQDYNEVNSLPISTRVKHYFEDAAYVGGIANLNFGFDEDNMDAYNYVAGIDGGYKIGDRNKIEAQVSTSRSRIDIIDDQFQTKKSGDAYYLSLSGSSMPEDGIMKKDYFNLASHEEAMDYYKYLFYFALMDENFESTLSNYHSTRDDAYWSRHLSFHPPQDLFFTEGLGRQGIDDFKPFAFGTGIDYGRYVIALRGEAGIWDEVLTWEGAIRNVHTTDDKYVETVIRNEFTHKTTDKLTTKLLFLQHDLPLTKENTDPFLSDSNGEFLTNDDIAAGLDADLSNSSLGLEYAFNDQWTWNGVYEYTNDFQLGSDNFPRGLLTSSNFQTFTENGQTFRVPINFTYSQTFFDLPPYEYHHVFSTGLEYNYQDMWNVYLDWTRNPNEFAGQIDRHMNHIGLSVGYKPKETLGFLTKYTYSRWNDINRVVFDQEVAQESYHNFYAEVRYKPQPFENFVFQYGVGSTPTISSATVDPFGGGLPVLDTQHIVRLSYLKYF